MNNRTPEYYKTKLKELDQNFYLILNEYVQQYPKSKTYSKIPTYQKSLEDDKKNLTTLQHNFFMMRNELEKEIINISNENKKTDKMIGKLNKDNKELNDSLNGLQQSSESAVGMFNDSQVLYNHYLLGNIYLLIGIISSCIFMYKLQ